MSESALIEHRLERYIAYDKTNRAYTGWQVDQFHQYLGQRILEIGCGVGGVIDLLGRRELIRGLDIESDVLAYAAQRFRERPECEFGHQDFGAIREDEVKALRDRRFDTIVCINVLEHIRDDLGALQRAAEILVAGGHLALLVPAHLELYGAYDRLDGHFRRYSRLYLRTLLLHVPLEPLRLYYFNALGALGWWVQYKLLRRTIHGGAQLGLMSRLTAILRPLESALRPPFGLSLVAICRKV